MNKPQKYIISFLPAAIFLFNQILIMFIRPIIPANRFELLSEIFGWLPNYLASVGFVLMSMLLLIIIKELKLDKKYARYYNIYMIFISVIALFGFIWWENQQKNNSMIYDLKDIYATVCGVITGYSIFLILYFKHKFNN